MYKTNMERQGFYCESHITITPVFGHKLEVAKSIAAEYGFKVADLLMQKRVEDRPERSKNDTFMTGHGDDVEDLLNKTLNLCSALQSAGYQVYRYKLEDCLIDSRVDDEYNMLTKGVLSA